MNLVSRRFGKLIALEYVKKNQRSHWICKCDCGLSKVINQSLLLNGEAVSCGCLFKHRDDITGQKVNKLTAIKPAHNNFHWECLCDCGKIRIVKYNHFVRKIVNSCGCDKGSWNRKEDGQSTFNFFYKTYKTNAKNKNLTFLLEKEFFKLLISNKCYYCGDSPRLIDYSNRIDDSGALLANGIDRIDSSQGYIASNVITCCTRCNLAKSDLSIKEFEDFVLKIISYNQQQFFISNLNILNDKYYSLYVKKANKRKIAFYLSLEEFSKFICENCYYCGAVPREMYRGWVANGIDRKDSDKPYQVDNCVTCCTRCNVSKNTMTEKYFIEHMNKIFINLNMENNNEK